MSKGHPKSWKRFTCAVSDRQIILIYDGRGDIVRRFIVRPEGARPQIVSILEYDGSWRISWAHWTALRLSSAIAMLFAG
jgi:hypothetical protein